MTLTSCRFLNYIPRETPRSGMLRRLSSYKCSKYRAYADDDQKIKWLNAELLLSQFLNVADRNLAYREAAQKYAKEEQRIWEDMRHGIFLGTKKFVQKIKKRYLPDIPYGEIPRQNKFSRVKSLIKI
jgi:predicted esterase YcpF (UPF0227 family)